MIVLKHISVYLERDMEKIIDVPEYNPLEGLRLECEINFRISSRISDNGSIIISANSPGLISLARHLLVLAQSSVPIGSHFHLDASNSLDMVHKN